VNGYDRPEAVRIRDVCNNARLLAEICDALGFEFRGAEPLIRSLEHRDPDDELVASDGDWILPEEI